MSPTATTTGPRLLTAEEFAQLPDPPDGSKHELVRGEVVTMPPPGFPHGTVQLNLAAILRMFVKQTKAGRVTVETGLVTERDLDTVRGPDVAFWSFARLPATVAPKGYPDVAADLVAEVLSPGNARRDMAEKVREYFVAGVRAVWVADPDARTVTAHSSPTAFAVLTAADTLTAPDVLPGFACPVAELFE